MEHVYPTHDSSLWIDGVPLGSTMTFSPAPSLTPPQDSGVSHLAGGFGRGTASTVQPLPPFSERAVPLCQKSCVNNSLTFSENYLPLHRGKAPGSHVHAVWFHPLAFTSLDSTREPWPHGVNWSLSGLWNYDPKTTNFVCVELRERESPFSQLDWLGL